MKAYQLGLYEKSMPNELTFSQKLKITKKSGFDFLELSVDETDEKLKRLDYSIEIINQMRHQMEKEDVFIQSICLSGHRKYPLGSEDPIISKQSLEIMRKAILFAHRLGVRYIQIAGYDEYYQTSNKQTQINFLKNLEQSVKIASTYGVVLAFETMETSFMNTVTKAMKYVNYVQSPYLKVYPDIGNLTNAAEHNPDDVILDLKNGKGHIVAAHLKETKPNVFRNLMFGKGHTNYQACLKELISQNVFLYVAEFWHNDKKNWRNNIKKAYTFLKEEIEGAMNS